MWRATVLFLFVTAWAVKEEPAVAVKEEVSETGEDDVEFCLLRWATARMSCQSQKIHFHWRQRRTCLLFLATVRAKRARRRTQEKGLQKQSVQFQRRQCWAVDPLDLALAGLGVPNLFQEVPSSDWAKAAKRGFKKLSLVHHPDKGGSRAAYDNLCRSWDVVRQHIADWTKIGDLMRCEIQCRCTDCLRLMTKMSRCRLCLGLGSKSGHSGCGLTSTSSYFRRYNEKKPDVLGKYYQLVAHGKEEKEARRILQGEQVRLAGEAKEMRRLESHKRKHLDHEADVEFQKELSKAIEESKASVWKKWAASNPTIPLPSTGGALADTITEGMATGS
ncbi:unnamed protein product, partial [Effrenium voratum]